MYKKPIMLLCFTVALVYWNTFSEGSLTVRTEPDGIELWLDDSFLGYSPIIDKRLKEGNYSLKIIDPVQQSSIIEEITIDDGENTIIDKVLTSKFGLLRVNSSPEGAVVSIATELGVTPYANEFMNPGKYRIEIQHPNKKYESVIEEIVIPGGGRIAIEKTLKKDPWFTKKDVWQIAFGVGVIAGYAWAITEFGSYHRLSGKNNYRNDVPELNESGENYRLGARQALTRSIIGITGGSLCLVGLEIVALF